MHHRPPPRRDRGRRRRQAALDAEGLGGALREDGGGAVGAGDEGGALAGAEDRGAAIQFLRRLGGGRGEAGGAGGEDVRGEGVALRLGLVSVCCFACGVLAIYIAELSWG